MNAKGENIIFIFLFLTLFILSASSFAQRKRFLKDPDFIITPSTPISLEKELEVFNDDYTDGVYRIAIGADVPNNKKPMQVIYQYETGHIFLILQKILGKDTIHKSFGFYPKKTMPLFFKRTCASQIKDNSKREHDVELYKMLTKKQFQTVVSLALQYSQRKYHLNKFNCYDYALYIFNAVAESDTLPVIHIRYPLFFGKGGSPCGFYKYIKQQKELNSVWAPNIKFGNLIAPVSTKRREQHLGNKE